MIPDGPLHPADALLALSTGLFVGYAARPLPRRWTAFVIAAVLGVIAQRHGDVVARAWFERPMPLLIASVAVVSVASARALVDRARPPTMRVVLPVFASLAVVWAMVPDTEAPLIAAAVMLGAVPGLPARDRSPCAGLLVALPFATAVVGTSGRPEALGPALVAGAAAGCAFYGVMTVIARSTLWAGTPATVVYASTSVRTTAPAPTMAP